MSSIDESKQFIPLNIAVLTVSDTRSLSDDKSGTTLADRLTAAGHKLAAREITTDDVEAMRDPIPLGDPGARHRSVDPGRSLSQVTGGQVLSRGPAVAIVTSRTTRPASLIAARRRSTVLIAAGVNFAEAGGPFCECWCGGIRGFVLGRGCCVVASGRCARAGEQPCPPRCARRLRRTPSLAQ